MVKEMMIGQHKIGKNYPAYFIADIAANHDGDLSKAKDLIYMAKEAGADAAKFQHFRAKSIVSDYGFRSLGNAASHQKSWKKSVYEVYQDAEVPIDWTPELKETCTAAGIDFFTSPYDINDLDYINQFVPAFKVGSGDITYHQIVLAMAKYNKPLLIATGASEIKEVQELISEVSIINDSIVLMQCNTNYTASAENFKYIQLNVLKQYSSLFPDVVLGLSDHTLGHTTVLGAIALGAKVIEKHFTSDNSLDGPDHKFSMNPESWKVMVESTRELESALGEANKKVEMNEKETVILQRRCLRAARHLSKGERLAENDLIALRPCPVDGIEPFRLKDVVGMRLRTTLQEGQDIQLGDLDA